MFIIVALHYLVELPVHANVFSHGLTLVKLILASLTYSPHKIQPHGFHDMKGLKKLESKK